MNKQEHKTPMREMDPKERILGFSEVALGYTAEMAVNEAHRCINCKNAPCKTGCPVEVKIPEFITLIKEEKFVEAYEKIRETNNLPAICGRVCPQETQCEERCVRGIKGESVGIGRLERFVADYAMEHGGAKAIERKSRGIKCAMIGSGPASLTCAADLAKAGYDVTIFEAFHTAGGVLQYGIPQFRLPKELVDQEIQTLTELGVKIELNMVVGRVLTIDELKEMGYRAIFIGSGAGYPKFMNIPGENLNGVYSANEFLTRINLMKAYQFPKYDTPIKKYEKVAVIGGGNVAMDAARCAKRLGAEHVYIVYRRGKEEMPARAEEVHHAGEEGIEFHLLTAPVRILSDEDNRCKQLELRKMVLGEPDESGRRRPVEQEGSEYTLDVDCVVVAIGQSPNPLIASVTPGLKTERWGGIIADEAGRTSVSGVYAGGDAVTGAATVILAMSAGKLSARAMMEDIEAGKI